MSRVTDAAATQEHNVPASPDDFVDEGASMSSGPEVDSEDDDVLAPYALPNCSPLCNQCDIRDWVWADVVRAYKELEDALDDFNYEAATGEDDTAELARMMERVEIDNAPLRALRRAVYIDVCRMRTMLIELGNAYGPDDWERRETHRMQSCFNAMFRTLDAMRDFPAARKFYANTMRSELGAIHTSFMVMNVQSGRRSLQDRELVFRARLALVLVSNASAIEPVSLRHFFIDSAPVLRSAVNALLTHLSTEAICTHNL